MTKKTKCECARCGSLIAEPEQKPETWFSICPKCEERLWREDKVHDTWQHDPIFHLEHYEP